MEAQGYAASALVTSGRMVFRCDLKNTFDERQVQRLERRKPMEPRRAWWLHGIVCSFGVRRAFGVIIGGWGWKTERSADPRRESKPSAHAHATHARHDRSMARNDSPIQPQI